MADFGSNLRDARVRAGLTQDELGEKIGAGGNTVARWERNERLPSDPAQLVKLAIELDTTVENLAGESPIRGSQAEAFREGLRAAARRMRAVATELDAGNEGHEGRPDVVLPPLPADQKNGNQRKRA